MLQGDGPLIAGPLQPKPLQLARGIDRQFRQRRAQMMAEAGLQLLDRKVEHNRLDVVGDQATEDDARGRRLGEVCTAACRAM